jgi:hypothetical protein
MSDRIVRYRFVDWLSGDLIVVYETPEEAVKRGLGEPHSSYGGYSERIPADEAIRLLREELDGSGT